jgi:cell division protein YceG involved in septum cleavage
VKLILAILLMLAGSALVAAAFVAAAILNYRPYDYPAVAEIRVEQGDSLAVVARKLRAQKLIANERLFLFWARLNGVETKIHLGLYRFEGPVSAR